ncbi:MAG: DUF4965 domain-containing protein [Bryobacteraceae bacterium]|nr:DUF4965 domain-containing protein [Bryobacteraceae bacterium]
MVVKLFIASLALLLSLAQSFAQSFRPPAAPLVAHDPYFSVWSFSDDLAGSETRHWTGAPHPLHAAVRVDGKTYRLMGADSRRSGGPAPLVQKRLQVLPTRTIYDFEGAGLHLTFTFLTPALPEDLDVAARPATYLVWEVRSADAVERQVELYFDATSSLVVDNPYQPVVWSRFKLGDMEAVRMGSRDQPVLEKRGDDLRIDWGYLYLTVPPDSSASLIAADRDEAWQAFQEDGRLPLNDELETHAPARFRSPALAAAFDLGKVGAAPVSRYAVLAYDDIFSIEYFHRKLRPYWRRKGATAADLLASAVRDYPALAGRCRRFDEELMADLRRAGGDEYALLAALAFRQTLAAHKLTADADGTPLLFSKENFSNGCIATVDVSYPSSPLFLLFNTRLLKAMVQPILDYAGMQRWPFPFAPHDLGTYPQANGQVYGGGEKSEDRQMPVEESGNMLIMIAAAAHADGDASFADRYWPTLARWAAYLEEKGFDPENQLCTDDFAGHLARNANLSLKAIAGLASFARLCDLTGRAAEGERYRRRAREFARRWMDAADDGDRYALAFGAPGTWSQKYNLVWDRLLGFNLFPPAVAQKEIAFYKTKMNPYGLPLDNRERYTKLDWIVWTATLAQHDADFKAMIAPAYRFAHETPDRVPLSDWYWTHDGRRRGFQARSVVGGVFIRMLADPDLWTKWAARGK